MDAEELAEAVQAAYEAFWVAKGGMNGDNPLTRYNDLSVAELAAWEDATPAVEAYIAALV